MDKEGAILSRQEDIYDGIVTIDDFIEIKKFDFATGRYVVTETHEGEAARRYMEEHGIY